MGVKLHTKYFSGDQSEENVMGVECGMQGERYEFLQIPGGWTWSKEGTWKTSTYVGNWQAVCELVNVPSVSVNSGEIYSLLAKELFTF